jgi:hypothetical protein
MGLQQQEIEQITEARGEYLGGGDLLVSGSGGVAWL